MLALHVVVQPFPTNTFFPTNLEKIKFTGIYYTKYSGGGGMGKGMVRKNKLKSGRGEYE